jgi:hypothetical protein
MSAHIHHAHLLIGSKENALKWFEELLANLSINKVGNPDVWMLDTSTFGIDEARTLSTKALQRAFVDKQFLFVSAEKYTVEAQNALLKTIEEPYSDTHFVIVVRESSMLLPTLISRVNSQRIGSEESNDSVEKFLQKNIKDRLAFAKKLVDSEESLTGFLDLLLERLRQKDDKKALANVYNMRRYSADRSASSRMILEHLAVTL